MHMYVYSMTHIALDHDHKSESRVLINLHLQCLHSALANVWLSMQMHFYVGTEWQYIDTYGIYV